VNIIRSCTHTTEAKLKVRYTKFKRMMQYIIILKKTFHCLVCKDKITMGTDHFFAVSSNRHVIIWSREYRKGRMSLYSIADYKQALSQVNFRHGAITRDFNIHSFRNMLRSNNALGSSQSRKVFKIKASISLTQTHSVWVSPPVASLPYLQADNLNLWRERVRCWSKVLDRRISGIKGKENG
jgi:hypothetical protein